jgi:DNA-binding protein H-NS
MRKPRDFDAALKTLTDKTRALKESKRRQLGELIVATGADGLEVEILAGGLLAMVKTTDAAQKEAWRKQGSAFFRKTSAVQSRASGQLEGAAQSHGRATPARSATGEA